MVLSFVQASFLFNAFGELCEFSSFSYRLS